MTARTGRSRAKALLLLSLMLGGSDRSWAAATAPESPKPWLQRVVEKAHVLARRQVAPNTKAEEKWQADAKAIIDDVLDWEELTRQTLGRHWNTRSEAEQREFKTLIREMIEASYRAKMKLAAGGSLKKPKKVEIEWLNEQIAAPQAVVAARIKSGKTVAVIEFKLHFVDQRWRVHDILIDDVSTVRTYRSQFAKIIGQDGFSALLTRMRQKITDIRAGRAELAR